MPGKEKERASNVYSDTMLLSEVYKASNWAAFLSCMNCEMCQSLFIYRTNNYLKCFIALNAMVFIYCYDKYFRLRYLVTMQMYVIVSCCTIIFAKTTGRAK